MRSFFLLLLFSVVCSMSNAQSMKHINFEDLHTKAVSMKDTVCVLNFWATWCKPCIEELPHFEKCNEEFKNRKVKIILVNLDFNSQVIKTAEPFVERKKLKSEILHLTDTDPNRWIDRIDTTWSGAIPATVIYLNGKKTFFKEGAMTEEELRRVLTQNLSKK